MLVNRINFFNTTSRHICFTTMEMISNAKAPTLFKCIENVVRLYLPLGFQVEEILMDGEFEPMRPDLLGNNIHLNTCSESEHVGEVERVNWTIKERTQGIYNTVPFEKMPGRLVVEMVHRKREKINPYI